MAPRNHEVNNHTILPGSGFASPPVHSSMLHRTGVRSVGSGTNHIGNNGLQFNPTNNNFMNYLLDIKVRTMLYELYVKELNSRYNHNHNHNLSYHHRQRHANYNNNSNSRRMTAAATNGRNGLTPVSTDYIPTSWDEIKGKVVEYANDKSLSSILMKKLKLGHIEGINIVVSEVKLGITQILFNQYGSPFFQTLLEILDYQHVFELLKAVMANQQVFLDICIDVHGYNLLNSYFF